MAKGKAKFFVQLGDKATGAMPGVELREMALAGNVTPQTNVALSKGSGAELQGVSAKRVNGLFDESDQPFCPTQQRRQRKQLHRPPNAAFARGLR